MFKVHAKFWWIFYETAVSEIKTKLNANLADFVTNTNEVWDLKVHCYHELSRFNIDYRKLPDVIESRV